MMFKVGSCNLCQRVFRTGGLRQLIQRDIACQSEEKARSGRKVMFSESRIVVCTECYKRLEKGEGVDAYDVVEDMLDGNVLGQGHPDKKLMAEGYKEMAKGNKGVMHEVTVDLANKAKEKSDAKFKKERKPRGKRVDTKGSQIIKSLAECTFEGEDTDEKPKGKRGRKPNAPKLTRYDGDGKSTEIPIDKLTKMGKDTDPLATEASESDVKADAENFNAGVKAEADAVKDTQSEEVTHVVEPVEEVKVTNQDRKQYKEQVRQALNENSEIMYSEIARRLNIDEGLVSQLANEIDGEA